MVKVDDTRTTAFPDPASTPTHLANAATLRDHIAGLRIGGDEVHKLKMLIFVPDVSSLTQKQRRLSNGDAMSRHDRCIRQ